MQIACGRFGRVDDVMTFFWTCFFSRQDGDRDRVSSLEHCITGCVFTSSDASEVLK